MVPYDNGCIFHHRTPEPLTSASRAYTYDGLHILPVGNHAIDKCSPEEGSTGVAKRHLEPQIGPRPEEGSEAQEGRHVNLKNI
ncbi:bmp-2 protein [Anopheles sinensis]|uniref:Bmp-2 protein n=1 Tax=Anopheles sinensis TaxID=74873 RepID=A0A084VDR8_ANOSI|nr:bmp-2 protein [Anopheles sinensis]